MQHQMPALRRDAGDQGVDLRGIRCGLDPGHEVEPRAAHSGGVQRREVAVGRPRRQEPPPRARSRAAPRSASSSAALSVPWQLACTITRRATPSWSCSANSAVLRRIRRRVDARRTERKPRRRSQAHGNGRRRPPAAARGAASTGQDGEAGRGASGSFRSLAPRLSGCRRRRSPAALRFRQPEAGTFPSAGNRRTSVLHLRPPTPEDRGRQDRIGVLDMSSAEWRKRGAGDHGQRPTRPTVGRPDAGRDRPACPFSGPSTMARKLDHLAAGRTGRRRRNEGRAVQGPPLFGRRRCCR